MPKFEYEDIQDFIHKAKELKATEVAIKTEKYGQEKEITDYTKGPDDKPIEVKKTITEIMASCKLSCVITQQNIAQERFEVPIICTFEIIEKTDIENEQDFKRFEEKLDDSTKQIMDTLRNNLSCRIVKGTIEARAWTNQ